MASKIHQRIHTWRDEGLISEEIARKLLARESSRDATSWVGYSIAGIGVTALATGVLSLVAANWNLIPSTVKILAYLLFQISLGVAFMRAEGRAGIWREVCLTLFALVFIAGIALFGQTFNLHGPMWGTLAFWCSLAFLPTLCAHSRFLPLVWGGVVFGASWLWCFESASYAARGTSDDFARFCGVVAVPLVLAGISFLLQARGYLREEFRSSLAIWGLGAMLCVITPFADLAWSSLGKEESINKSALLLPWVCAVLAAGASLARGRESHASRILAAALCIMTMIFFSGACVLRGVIELPEALGKTIGAAGFLTVWSIAAAAAVCAGMRRLFDIASFVIAVRFIVIYFQVFGSLSTTGIGLIVSGAVIIAIGIAWNRARGGIRRWVEAQS